MANTHSLDDTINTAAFWSAIILILSGLLTGNLVTADIGVYFESIGVLLLVPVISMAVYFRKAMKATGKV